MEDALAKEPLVYLKSENYERIEIETLRQEDACDEYSSGVLECRVD